MFGLPLLPAADYPDTGVDIFFIGILSRLAENPGEGRSLYRISTMVPRIPSRVDQVFLFGEGVVRLAGLHPANGSYIYN